MPALPRVPPDDAALERGVAAANLPTLMLVTVHLTGDPALLRGDIRPRRASPMRPDGGLGADEAAAVRARALSAIRAHRDSGAELPPLPPPQVLAEMMSFSLGQPVPAEYVPMMLQDMRLAGEEQARVDLRPLAAQRGFRVLVIGAGMSGLLAAIELSRAGIDFTVVEKNSEVGGTWFENSYPGCRVDLPSHFYSYSFEPNPDWSDHFARRSELLTYFRRIASDYGVRDAIRFETEVVAARYDADQARWRVTLRAADGRESTLEANALVSAVGQLNRPSIPALPGVERFAGPAFHSAAFRHDVELSGRRVGVVGTGASAMQIVPQLAGQAARVVVFQRSPQWALPNPDYFREVSEGEKWMLRNVPYYAPWYRFRLFYINGDGVHAGLHMDPEWPHPRRSLNATNDRIREMLSQYIVQELGERQDLLARVLPDYPPFAKRMLLDNAWFRTMTRDDVELVTEAIDGFTESGVRLADGSERGLDVLIYATGFQANRFLWPMSIAGAGGRLLHEVWGDDPRAYLGITAPDFPNLFMLYGPNTNLAHGGSIIFHSECQMRYIRGCLELLLREGHAAMEPRRDVHDAYNARVDAAHERMVWSHPHVSNWYKNAAGRVTTNSPFRLVDYWAMTRAPDPNDFVFTR